jgi:polysaccharide biosynthesis transport protein
MINDFQNNNSVKREPMSLTEFLFIIKIYRRYFYVTITLAILATLYSHLSFSPSYVAESRVDVQDDETGSNTGAKIGLDGAVGFNGSEDLLEKYLAYIKSSEFFITVAQDVKYKQLSGEKKLKFYRDLPTNAIVRFFTSKEVVEKSKIDITTLSLEDISGMLGGMIKIQNSGTRTIQVLVASPDAETSVVVANSVAETFITQVMMRNRQEINEVQNFVQERLEETTEKLKTSEMELVNYKQKYNIVSAEEGSRQSIGRLGKLDSDLEELKIRIRENERLVDYYQKKIAQKDEEILAQGTAVTADDPNAVRGRIETLRKQQASLRAMGLKENESMLTDVNKSLSESKEKLRLNLGGSLGSINTNNLSAEEIKEKIIYLNNDIKQTSMKLREVVTARDELQATMSALPGREQELQSLERSVALQYELYTLLKKRQQEIEIQKAGLKNPVRLSQKSTQASATRPPALILRMIFALMAGIFMGGVITLGFELMNFTVKHRADLEAAELISLGNIPFVKTRKKKNRVQGSHNTDLLVCAREPDSAESMSFKFLRAQLRNIMNNDINPAKVVSITSSDRADGKSFVSANLAVCFAQMQKKTIVIDADIRNPSIQKYFGFRNEEGLTCLLEMKRSLSEVIIKEKIPFLDILPAGTMDRNPTEVLSGERFSTLIKFLKSKYDYVIIDSPPALFVVDAAIVTSVADTAVVVARYRKTKRDALALAHRKILQIAPKTIYAVLNGVQDIHEYVNYRAESYFEKKLMSVKSFVDRKKNLEEQQQETQKFGTFLSMEDEKKKKVG